LKGILRVKIECCSLFDDYAVSRKEAQQPPIDLPSN
jgi:hypothetical protein